ncbi:family 16 glycosylhydrolase [Anaerohalosphaera lusitana]|nr:family 16 glycosylhydrolase [Anaerohalosphaera lusitana]
MRLFLLLLFCLSNLSFANLLSNPGFEDGGTGQLTYTTIPGWSVWGTNGWHHNDPGRTIEQKAVKLWWDDAGLFQDFSVTGGKDYRFSASMLSGSSEPLTGWEGIVKAEFYDGVNMQPSDAVSVTEIGRFYPGDDAVDQWKKVSSTVTAPAEAEVGRIVFMITGTSGSGALNFDSASVGAALPSADFNGDGLTDMRDLARLGDSWMQANSACDLDGSGLIDIDDLLVFASEWLTDTTIYAGYDLVWADEFDGNTLDEANWTRMTISGADSGNWELQHYTDEAANACVADGELVIKAMEQSYWSASENRMYDYTSARLTSTGKRDFLYGIFEARIKIPTGQGIWPAFWMLPSDWEYGGWPASGEIDIMEAINDTDVIHGTIHYGGQGAHDSSGGSYSDGGVNFGDDYHIYTMVWEPTVMHWYVDGQLYSTKSSWWSEGEPFPAPFDKRFHLLLNIAVGGNWPGSPDETTVFPQTMHVDYVRVYQREQ